MSSLQWCLFSYKSVVETLKSLFNDVDVDGLFGREEIAHVLRKYFAVKGMSCQGKRIC